MQSSPWAIERVPSTTTTMDVAKQRARTGAPDGTVIVAEEMTAGRGTHGRQWHSPKGGLYLSIVLRDIPDPHLLTLALGTAVAAALEVAGVEPQLKWVNDVWIGGKKVAGILVEAESTGNRIDFVVAGLGVNINGLPDSFPPPLQGQATTLEAELGCDSCIPDFETLLLTEVANALQRVRGNRNEEILATFRARDALKGQRVVIQDGVKEIVGVADGVDGRGRLLVKARDGVLVQSSGSVRLAA